jgi:hypothetical protein
MNLIITARDRFVDRKPFLADSTQLLYNYNCTSNSNSNSIQTLAHDVITNRVTCVDLIIFFCSNERVSGIKIIALPSFLGFHDYAGG